MARLPRVRPGAFAGRRLDWSPVARTRRWSTVIVLNLSVLLALCGTVWTGLHGAGTMASSGNPRALAAQ